MFWHLLRNLRNIFLCSVILGQIGHPSGSYPHYGSCRATSIVGVPPDIMRGLRMCSRVINGGGWIMHILPIFLLPACHRHSNYYAALRKLVKLIPPHWRRSRLTRSIFGNTGAPGGLQYNVIAPSIETRWTKTTQRLGRSANLDSLRTIRGLPVSQGGLISPNMKRRGQLNYELRRRGSKPRNYSQQLLT